MKGKKSHCMANFATFVPKTVLYNTTETKMDVKKVVILLNRVESIWSESYFDFKSHWALVQF